MRRRRRKSRRRKKHGGNMLPLLASIDLAVGKAIPRLFKPIFRPILPPLFKKKKKRRKTRTKKRRKRTHKRRRKRRRTRKRRKTRKKRGGAPRLSHKLATPAELNEKGITWEDGTHATVNIVPRDITSDGKHKVVSVGFALAVEKKLNDLAVAINDCHPVGCRKRDKEATKIQAAHRGSMLRKHPPEVLKIHQQFKPDGPGMVEAGSQWENKVGKRRRTSGGRKTRKKRRKTRQKKKKKKNA